MRRPWVAVVAWCALAACARVGGWEGEGCGVAFPPDTPLVVGAKPTLRIPLPFDPAPRPVTVVSDAPDVLVVTQVGVVCRSHPQASPQPCQQLAQPLVALEVEVHARRPGSSQLRAPEDDGLFAPLLVRVDEARHVVFTRDGEVIETVTTAVDACVAVAVGLENAAGEALVDTGAKWVTIEDRAVAVPRFLLGIEACGRSPGQTALLVTATTATGRLPVHVEAKGE